MKLFKSGLFFSAISVFESITPLVLLPFLTKYLSVSDYGYLYTIVVIINISTPFLLMGYPTFQSKEYYQSGVEFRKKVLGTYLYSQFYIAGFLGLISIPVYFIIGFFGLEDFQFIWLVLIFATSFLNAIFKSLKNYFRISFNTTVFGLGSFIKVFADIFLAMIFVYYISNSWTSKILASTVTTTFLVIFACLILYKQKSFQLVFNRQIFRNWVKFGFPLIFQRISQMVLNLSDRLLISMFLGTTATGIYTVGYQIGAAMQIFSLAVGQGWSPWFYKKYNSDQYDQKQVNKYIMGITLIAIAIYLLFITFGLKLLPLFVDLNKFQGIQQYVVIIGLSFVFYSIIACYTPFLMVANKTKQVAAITTIASVLNVLLNIAFLKTHGPIVAAYTTLICSVLQLVLILYFVKKELVNNPST
ncbi:MAG: oligosaccharide flippase family protein [Reichenbachiella sp.]|uniref:lipopolysaccharide biosynthesis protein n=1 Tax=Reichenbachiella sp. TaxID=2184521 RepID=UPI003264833C